MAKEINRELRVAQFGTKPAEDRARIIKRHNIVIERWPGNPGPRSERGSAGFRWTVSYEREGRFYGQGFADTHPAARAAAERFLVDQGIDMDWLPPSAVAKERSGKLGSG